MLLRPRQQLFVDRCIAALRVHRDTLGVAPTGSGKTIMFSAATGRLLKGGSGRACVIAHRDEITEQNRDKFSRVNPGVATSVVDARSKDWSGQAAFGMILTLARAANLAAMPALDVLVIDEAHHAAAESYRRVIGRARELNGRCMLFGLTATPKETPTFREAATGFATRWPWATRRAPSRWKPSCGTSRSPFAGR